MKDGVQRFNLGTYLKTQRERLNLTQADLAKSIKVRSAQNISNWERNLKVPSKRNLLALVIELDLDAELMADFLLQKPKAKIVKDLKSAKSLKSAKRAPGTNA